MNDPAAVKSLLKDEFHGPYDEFRADHEALDGEQLWAKHYNDGDLQDKSKSPFMLLSSSDEIFYCMENGYFNNTIFNSTFHALDTADQIRFIEAWTYHYDQVI